MTWTFPAPRLKGMTRLNAEGHGCWRCRCWAEPYWITSSIIQEVSACIKTLPKHIQSVFPTANHKNCKGSSHSCWRVGWCGITARSVPDFREDEPDPILPGGCEITYRGSTAALRRLLFGGRGERPVRKRQPKGEGGGDPLSGGFSAVFLLTRSPTARKPGQEGSAASVETVPN